jgi:phosphomannomutase
MNDPMDIDSSIFKSYDIRGTFPDQINVDIAYKIAQGFVKHFNPQGKVLVGNDVRIHSEEIKNALAQGLIDAGVDVVDVGLISTDMSYFGVGYYKLAGALQATASHNPPEYHGVKLTGAGVTPISFETGISAIKDFVLSGEKIEKNKGKIEKLDLLEDYCRFILGFIDISKVKPLKVVINPNFGAAGIIFNKLIEIGKLPIEIIPLNEQPDGTFPKGRPDPFVPENRGEFVELVKTSGADLGITWDADSDRVFFCANGGVFVEPYYLNTLLIASQLEKYPGEKIIYDIRYTWGLIDAIIASGGVPIVSRVGHSYIKQKMREENALFATESSGHTYFRDFWFADCGMLPAVQMLEYLSLKAEPLSELINPIMQKYIISGEINTTVDDVPGKLAQIKEKYSDGNINELDGITVEYDNFRFNVRPSNTEPLLRLNLEAKSEDLMEQKKTEVLGLIRGENL